ncbi:transposase [Streptomyces parvus]|uniref:transposase n=1 Tax=Streptomyces parvus TaxID=66428 RepID=UPI003813EC9D
MPAASPHPFRDLPFGSRLSIHESAIRCPGSPVRVRLSVGRTGQCWDNALAESFFSTIKRELLGTSAWPSRAAARTAIFDFIEGWYNLHRLHSSLGYLSPAEYETALAA